MAQTQATYQGNKVKDMTITHDIKAHLGDLGQPSKSGWRREVNLVSWNGDSPKIDIRSWSPDHTRMGKGITLTQEEFETLQEFELSQNFQKGQNLETDLSQTAEELPDYVPAM